MATIISTKTSSVGGLSVTGDASGILQLASADGTTAVTIDASQNVGIGTSSPSGKLEVVSSADRIFRVTGGTDTPVQIRSTIANCYMQVSGSAADLYLGNVSGSYTVTTGGTERMRIDSGGSLYLNTTSQVGNTLQVMGLKFNGATQWGLSFGNLNSGNTGSAINFCNYAGTQIGTIQLSASATAYVTSSDYRLKENIQPMVGALDTIAQLKPVTYTWLEDGVNGQGFIAHELQEIFPDAVAGEKDAVAEDGSIIPQGIDPSKLVATLTAAIQELKAIIDTQTARIEALEAKI